jgi:rubrerythrin
MKPLETTVEEVLLKAIQAEVDTRVYYQKLAERAGSAAVRKRMLELADDELVHRAKLERKYRDAIGKASPDPTPPAPPDFPPEFVDLDMSRALKHALERERDSESYFRFMAERVPVDTDLGRLFLELAEMEWKHKTDLQREYDASVASDPEQFLLDI